MVVLSSVSSSTRTGRTEPLKIPNQINESKSNVMVAGSSSRSSGNGSMETEEEIQAPYLFYDHYAQLCEKLNCSSFLRSNQQPKYLNRAVLSFVTDRLSFTDWLPLIESLRYDRSLHLIEIKARKQLRSIHEQFDSERKIRLLLNHKNGASGTIKNFNFLQTRLILNDLIDAICNGPILQSNVLSYVCLNGIRLNNNDLDRVLAAIELSGRLQHLSFERCSIGDKGCELLYQRLKNMPSLSSINVAGCNLTRTGIVQLANLIKFQKNQRFCEIWKISLRNRKANLNEMQGLRHMVLNNNPEMGDDGCRELIDVLADDLWLKTIELQNCGLTNNSNESIRQLLTINRTLEQFDVRDNRKLSARFSNECFAAIAAPKVDLSVERTDSLIPFSSDDSKENSVLIDNGNLKSNQINVVPFKSRYRTDNYELLNAKRTISSLQQQLKREQSRNERLTIVRRKQQLPNAPAAAGSAFNVGIDIRQLTEFIRTFVIERFENKSFRMGNFRQDFKSFILPLAKSNDRFANEFMFDEQTVCWCPKNTSAEADNNDSGSIAVTEDNETDRLTWPRTYSNFISCDGDNSIDERVDKINDNRTIESDSNSFVIKELLKSFQ